MLSDKLRDELGADAFTIDFMFADRQIAFQTLLMNTSERAQKVAGCRPQPFDGVDLDLSYAIAILISRPSDCQERTVPLHVRGENIPSAIELHSFPFSVHPHVRVVASTECWLARAAQYDAGYARFVDDTL